ncbi:hypothetical protein LUZ60_006899 [Juncus effusus]|nr:hypothetical protein LUZ60_006899 [Juncus effusus]
MAITGFPVLSLTILGVITASAFLISYYIFVIKFCLKWNRFDTTRNRQRGLNQSLTIYQTNPIEPHGLDESTIESIPTFKYKKGNSDSTESNRDVTRRECAVCLNEFKDDETVRLLPNCLHVFHVECIDTWLRTNANCPLCRSLIENPDYSVISVDQLENHVHSENDQNDTIINVEEEKEENNGASNASGRNNGGKMKSRKLFSMGDECVEMRKIDKQFNVRPIRRSFSLDSSNERWLYKEVEKILQQNPHFLEKGIPESSRSKELENV